MQAQLENLLSLKQQQAGIVEARESIRQGRTMMAFTLVTIFFVRLLRYLFRLSVDEMCGHGTDIHIRSNLRSYPLVSSPPFLA